MGSRRKATSRPAAPKPTDQNRKQKRPVDVSNKKVVDQNNHGNEKGSKGKKK